AYLATSGGSVKRLDVDDLDQNPSRARFSWTDGSNGKIKAWDLEELKLEPDLDHNVSADWKKAARYAVDGQFVYDLTLSEGEGFYAWRVRPVGDYYPGGRSDRRNYGTWSAV